METSNELKELEKKSYLIYLKDGIIELLFGSILMIYATNTLLDNLQAEPFFLIRIMILPVTLILAAVKIFVTSKRIGYVKFSWQRRHKMKWMLAVAISAQIITLVAYIASISGWVVTEDKSSLLSLTVEFFFLVGVLGLIAWFTEYKTFLIFGIVLGISTPLMIFLDYYFPTQTLRLSLMYGSGLIFTIYGIIGLVSFLKKYPKQTGLHYD